MAAVGHVLPRGESGILRELSKFLENRDRMRRVAEKAIRKLHRR